MTTDKLVSRPARVREAQGGPPLIIPGLAFAAFSVLGGVIGAGGPRITSKAADIASYYTDHHTVALLWGTVVFASALPLAIWTATIYGRLRQLGITAPGAVMGLSGGLLASAALAASGLSIWATAEIGPALQPGVAAALNALAFATGGAGFVVPLGLLLAGVCVPALFARLLPRPLVWFGLVVAALATLATFSLLASPLDVLLPIGRFGGGVIWLLAVSLLLPTGRRRGEPTAEPRLTAE